LTEFSQNSPITTADGGADVPIRVAIILSSKLERLGWAIVIDSQADMQVVGQFPVLTPALAFLTTAPVDVALVDETMLTPKVWDAIRKHTYASRPRFLVIAQHPVDASPVAPNFPLSSLCLLKGVSATDLLAAIRKAGQANQTKSANGAGKGVAPDADVPPKNAGT
jgi:DNA-binding NarL/FixJ family response regulator